MNVTITIKVEGKGKNAVAAEIESLLPTRDMLIEYIDAIVPAVLPVKFRIADRQKHSAFIQFDD